MIAPRKYSDLIEPDSDSSRPESNYADSSRTESSKPASSRTEYDESQPLESDSELRRRTKREEVERYFSTGLPGSVRRYIERVPLAAFEEPLDPSERVFDPLDFNPPDYIQTLQQELQQGDVRNIIFDEQARVYYDAVTSSYYPFRESSESSEQSPRLYQLNKRLHELKNERRYAEERPGMTSSFECTRLDNEIEIVQRMIANGGYVEGYNGTTVAPAFDSRGTRRGAFSTAEPAKPVKPIEPKFPGYYDL